MAPHSWLTLRDTHRWQTISDTESRIRAEAGHLTWEVNDFWTLACPQNRFQNLFWDSIEAQLLKLNCGSGRSSSLPRHPTWYSFANTKSCNHSPRPSQNASSTPVLCLPTHPHTLIHSRWSLKLTLQLNLRTQLKIIPMTVGQLSNKYLSRMVTGTVFVK